VLTHGSFFVSQVGLATGRARVADAAAMIRARSAERVHA
jgi:hypothetical protein